MRRRALIVSFLVLGIAGFLAAKAFVSPAVPFLRPGFQGSWIVHPAPPLYFHRRNGERPCPAMIFRHRFRAASGASLPVRVTALQRFSLRVNGVELPHRPPGSWKRWTSFDLAPSLHAAGENELSLWVDNPSGPPAMLVEGPAEVRSGPGWTVSLEPDFTAETPAVHALAGEWYMVDRPNPLRLSPLFPLFLTGMILLLAFLVYAAVPRGHAPRPRDQPRAREPWRFLPGFLRRHGFCLLLLVIVAVWQVHNARAFEYEGCDRRSHIRYVQLLANAMAAGKWTVPNASQGWETYHPPLYYAFSALVYSHLGGEERDAEALRGVQVASSLVCLFIPVFAWLALCQLFPSSQRARNLGLTVVALLPMPFSHSPIISNEGFAATLIGGTILFAVWLASRQRVSWLQAALLGAACAAALLAKYTSLCVFGSVAVALCLRRGREGWTAWRAAAVMIGVALALCGWYYGRNVVLFGRVFPVPQDFKRLAFYQVPGYRDLSFYTRFGPSLFQEPEKVAFESFWDGMFASLWADGQTCGFLDQESTMIVRLEAITLWLALLPAAAILLGFAAAVRRLIAEGFDHSLLVPVLTPATTVTAVALYTLEQPVFSVVKAWYLWSLLVPAALFAALGLERMSRQLGRLRFLLYGHLAVLSGLILVLYWYR
jgi:hypothetical protein